MQKEEQNDDRGKRKPVEHILHRYALCVVRIKLLAISRNLYIYIYIYTYVFVISIANLYIWQRYMQVFLPRSVRFQIFMIYDMVEWVNSI